MFLLIILFINRYLAIDRRVFFGITARSDAGSEICIGSTTAERIFYRICVVDVGTCCRAWQSSRSKQHATYPADYCRLIAFLRFSFACRFLPLLFLHPSVRRCAYSPFTLREFPPHRTLRAYICICATHIRTYGLITSCIAALRCTIREIKRRNNFDDAVMIRNY